MLIQLHKQATTTPKIRTVIQASDEPAWIVAERYGISEQTVWKWRKRDSVQDRSHTAHRLQTTLTRAQEAVTVALRKTLLVSLDDLLAVVGEFLNPDVSRLGLDRCLRRHGVGNLRDLKAKDARPKHSDAAWLYNQQLPQSALGSRTPLQATKDWHKLKPEIFKKQPY
jgi:transposase-like protein